MPVDPLDNPVWSALSGPQARLSVSSGRFARYRDDVGVFVAVANPADGFDGLAGALPANALVGIVTAETVEVPPGFDVVEVSTVPQMVASDFQRVPIDRRVTELGDANVPAMLELTALTRPGPFLSRTIEMGRYVGVFDGTRLVAMAGERMRPAGFTEISAVCTHPDFQGRGHAKALMTLVADGIVARGETPFLHVRAANAIAIGAYRSLGFVVRREMVFTVLRKSSP
ncbi:MAG: GNAT family N-acetyltransferase [Devosia sp.]